MRSLWGPLLAAVTLGGCPKKDEPKAAPAPGPEHAARKDDTAEVEFFGTVLPGKVTAAKTIFVVMPEACVPVPAEVHPYGQDVLTSQKLFAEYFPPQGASGHICAYGLDADGKVIAVATYAKNPVSFKGDGEVIFGNVDLTLEGLSESKPAPKGLKP
jgi:hypothetical protein